MRAVRVALALAAVAAVAASAGRGAPQREPVFALWALGGHPEQEPERGGNLAWRGGAAGEGAIGVEREPAVYVVYWGAAWKRGFRIHDGARSFSSRALQRYVNAFFAEVGGSAWAGVQTQYCGDARPGGTSCDGAAGFVANPPRQLRGVWTDSSPIPRGALTLPVDARAAGDPVAAEARRAVAHFGHDPQATVVVLAPPSAARPRGPFWCGYHSQTETDAADGTAARVQYAFIPWLDRSWPGLGRGGCGTHRVNARSDAFGHGIFDGWSIVGGHEYAETVVDPDNFANVQDGWTDGYSRENGDKCAWRSLRNVRLGAHRFAVQPLWSNEAYVAGRPGCVFSR